MTFTGLCGLGLLFCRGNSFAWISSVAFVAFSAVYYVIQVSPRYRFPLEPILFLLAANQLVEALRLAVVKIPRLIRN